MGPNAGNAAPSGTTADDAREARDGALVSVGMEGYERAIASGGMATQAMYAQQMMATMTPEAMRAAYERHNAALAAMGPQMMASYAAYMAYVQSQTYNAQAYAGMIGASPPFHGAYGTPAMGATAYGGEATSAHTGRGGGGGARKGGKGGRAGRKEDGTQSLRARKAANVKNVKSSTKVKAQKICVNCKSSETPFWRKDKDGIGSLCNACGLYAAKNHAPRPALLWKRPGATGSENDGSDKTGSDKTTEAVPSGSSDAAENKSKQDGHTSLLKTSGSDDLTATTTTTTTTTTDSDDAKIATQEAKLNGVGRGAE